MLRIQPIMYSSRLYRSMNNEPFIVLCNGHPGLSFLRAFLFCVLLTPGRGHTSLLLAVVVMSSSNKRMRWSGGCERWREARPEQHWPAGGCRASVPWSPTK